MPAAFWNSDAVGPDTTREREHRDIPPPEPALRQKQAEPLACGIGGHLIRAGLGMPQWKTRSGRRPNGVPPCRAGKVGEMHQGRAVQLNDPEFAFAVTRAERALGADARIV